MPRASAAGGTGRARPREPDAAAPSLELTDALTADAGLGGEAIVGAPDRPEGARGEDQPTVFLKLIEQIPGQLRQVAVWHRRPGARVWRRSW